MKNKTPKVYVVHCIDTEGPMYQSLEAIFELLNSKFNLDFLPSNQTLRDLQEGKLDIPNKIAIQTFLDPHLIQSHGTWNEIDEMLETITSDSFRLKFADSYGKPWIYNWFCMDHVGFEGYNPRRRDAGYHNIYDHYIQMPSITKYDHISFHYHPIAFNKDYHASGTSFWGGKITEILSRRLIDRGFFPSTFRPGFHTERPDSHFFLEQWIPFDYANQSTKGLDTNQPDCGNGRFGDWRRATKEWEIYHPSHDDYQIKGNCRRYIARCLNMYARLRSITQEDVNDAFMRAKERQEDVLLSFSCHDYRNMEFEIKRLYEMLENASAQYLVPFQYAKADEAMRQTLKLQPQNLDLTLSYDWEQNKIDVTTNQNIFGPQPFLAIKTFDNLYFHDNFDFYAPLHWTYHFDSNTIRAEAIEKIAVASNTLSGTTECLVWDKKTNKTNRYKHNFG